MRAAVYECDFRPIALAEHIVYGSAVHSHAHERQRTLPPPDTPELGDAETNAVVELARETAADAALGVLVFCESRRRCEDLALMLHARMPPPASPALADARREVAGELATSPAGLDPVLARTVPAGVAFHHAGLTSEERDIVTAAYNAGSLKAVFCTATMAAGVNLPARRVVISPRMGRGFVDAAMLYVPCCSVSPSFPFSSFFSTKVLGSARRSWVSLGGGGGAQGGKR